MGGHGGYGGLAALAGCFVIIGIVLGFIGICCFISSFITFIIAGVVAFGPPFSILPLTALIIGIIGTVLTVIMVFVCCFSFCFGPKLYLHVLLIIFQSMFGIIVLISVPVAIILAIGFSSLKSSLDVVLLAKPLENIESAADWITQTQKKMSSANILLIIGFVFVTVAATGYLIILTPSIYEHLHLPKEERTRALVIAVVQLLCGFLLFLPLQLLGRPGFAPFGFVALRDITYTGLYVLGVVVVALGTVNAVVVGVSLVLRTRTLSCVLGAVGCAASVAILVFALIVLAERAKAETNLQVFCTADEGTSPHTRCDDLLVRYQASMCVGGGDGERAGGVREEAEGEDKKAEKGEVGEENEEEGEDEDEGRKEHCEDLYTMDILQKKLLASTRDWMGFMGFACIILACVHAGLSLMVALCFKSEEVCFNVGRKKEEPMVLFSYPGGR